MKWTTEKDEIMTSLIKEGKSYNFISELLNVSPNSIRSRCNRLGIKSSDYKISTKHKCLNCGIEFSDNKDRKFCNHSCSATFNNKIEIEPKYCKNCNKEIPNRNIYCSNTCQNEYKYNEYIKKWKNGDVDGCVGKGKNLSRTIRKYIFEKYDNKCSICGWNTINKYTGNIPLEIDHIDGNHTNNNENNLRLICPNCHSLTENYGSRNKGNGRDYRRIWRSKDVD